MKNNTGNLFLRILDKKRAIFYTNMYIRYILAVIYKIYINIYKLYIKYIIIIYVSNG